MRVISGNLKGKKLRSFQGTDIRPTADRLREAIFNILSSRFQTPAWEQRAVLDLFAGTGAFGIEALSRGAESAVFIEQDKAALSLITHNIKSCRLEHRTKCIKWDISANLNCIKSDALRFDLVFMDPPYNKNLIKPALYHLHTSQSLKNEAIVVAEHIPAESVSEDICESYGFMLTDQRKYGKTFVSFFKYTGNVS